MGGSMASHVYYGGHDGQKRMVVVSWAKDWY